MNATEIVIREVQRNSSFQVRELLAESVGQPRESAHLHSHGQVLSLYKAGRNLIRVGVTLSDFGYRLRDAWWGVPRIGALSVVPENLHKLREVHFRPKALRDAHGVVVQAVRGKLHSIP